MSTPAYPSNSYLVLGNLSNNDGRLALKMSLNPSSPNIQIQILQIDLYILP